MNAERIHQIILAPVVSEKATRVAEKQNQAIFKVLLTAEKPEIKEAIETLFNVKVTGVQTLVVKGKAKKFGRFDGKRNDWKKAYVSLAEGQEIDFLGNGSAQP